MFQPVFDAARVFAHVSRMEIALTPLERLARARADMRSGVPVVLTSGTDAVIAVAAETCSDDRLTALRESGEVSLTITAWRAETLKARAYDGDIARMALPGERGMDWVRAVADPADDLDHPMMGPFTCHREGDAALNRAAVALAKSAHLLPAVLTVQVTEPAQILTVLELDTLGPLFDAAPRLREIVSARLPVADAGATRLHVFRPEDGGEEHYAIEVGAPSREGPVLTRLHSACFTGDILGSLKCDCGPQLHGALAAMGEVGAGVLLYLNQEGRGIGLANKMRAYSLQDQGFDTVEANHRLGFEDDERDFRIGAGILRGLGFSSVRLMTNNPAKAEMLAAQGLEVVERVPLRVGENPLNTKYLKTKASKSGHLL